MTLKQELFERLRTKVGLIKAEECLTSLISALVKRVEGMTKVNSIRKPNPVSGYNQALTDIVDMLKEASCGK